MNFWCYLEEKLFVMMGNLFLMVLAGVYLRACGNPGAVIFYFIGIWLLILAGNLVWGYERQRRKYREMCSLFAGLEEKYLICELMGKPKDQTEKMYYEMLRGANKAMAEKIEEVQKISREYKEYVEEWIHEVKTPIAAGTLICSNHPSPQNGRIKKEFARIGELVEQVLYFARSEQVEKDYFISECILSDVVNPAPLAYRPYILERGIGLQVEELSETVYTDGKWMRYILGQILSNAVKYQDKEEPGIHIYSGAEQGKIRLCVEDNGRGIPPEDLPRIFDKGFTGGDRQKNGATGIGLYLCKKLCERLGIALSVASKEGEGTTVTLEFPVGNLHRM